MNKDGSIYLEQYHHMTYKFKRECMKCGHIDEIEVSEREAAFELVDINTVLGTNCRQCSSTQYVIYHPRPKLSISLLKEWALNLDLYLMEQDEDLILAEGQYLDMILKIIDTEIIPDEKRNLLMSALCVMVYDNSDSDHQNPDIELRARVVEELNKRSEKLLLADDWIMDYIKKVVYPQLNF